MSMKSEKYKSKSQMRRHEKMEGAKEMMMEYGAAKRPVKKVAKKAVAKRVAKKAVARKRGM